MLGFSPSALAQFFGWAAIAFSLFAAISGGIALHYRSAVGKADEATRKAQVEGLNRTLDGANKRVAELERLRTPRNLSESQRQALAAFLVGKAVGRLTIKASVTAPDAKVYGDQIAAVFRAAGWNVPVDNAAFMGGDTSGVWITVRDATIPDVANTVHAALRSAEISIREGAMGDLNGPAPDEAWLKIGSIK